MVIQEPCFVHSIRLFSCFSTCVLQIYWKRRKKRNKKNERRRKKRHRKNIQLFLCHICLYTACVTMYQTLFCCSFHIHFRRMRNQNQSQGENMWEPSWCCLVCVSMRACVHFVCLNYKRSVRLSVEFNGKVSNGNMYVLMQNIMRSKN